MKVDWVAVSETDAMRAGSEGRIIGRCVPFGDILYLGETTFRQSYRRFGIQPPDRLSHLARASVRPGSGSRHF